MIIGESGSEAETDSVSMLDAELHVFIKLDKCM